MIKQLKLYGLIYRYRCIITRKTYIGQTTRSLNSRMRQHLSKAKKNASFPIDFAIQKHGMDNFVVRTLYVVFLTGDAAADQRALDHAEQSLILDLSCLVHEGCGYNLKTGGGRGKHSSQTKAKISKANASNLRAQAEKVRGIPRSLEVRQKVSAALTGRPSPRKGKKLSPSHAAKLREICLKNAIAMRGKPPHNKGKPSPLRGHIGKPSPYKGMPRPTETKARISAATKVAWQKRKSACPAS